MQTLRALSLGPALALVCACARPAPTPTPPVPPPPAPTPEAVVVEVGQAVEKYRQAFEVRSLDALAALYSQTEDLVVVAQGREWRGWSAVQSRLASFLADTQKVRLRLDQVQVVALGDGGAAAHARAHRQYGDGVATIEERGFLTLVFRRHPDGWKIVSEHYSYAPVTN